VFLTPGLKPVYGGTYFPPAPTYGRPAFTQILEALAKQWRDDPVQYRFYRFFGFGVLFLYRYRLAFTQILEALAK
jgi:hypothetical protein